MKPRLYPSAFGLIAALSSISCYGQVAVQSTDPQVEAIKGQYQQLLNQAAKQAATSKQALPDVNTDETRAAKAAIKKTMASVSDDQINEVRAQNQADLNSVSQDKIDQIRQTLPHDIWTSMASHVAQGKGAMNGGEAGRVAITLIRGLADPKVQSRNLNLLRQYAEAKVPEALNFYGYMFEKGLFMPANPKLAESYYLAAGQQYAPALYNLGLGAFYGRLGQRANPGQAVIYLDRARQLGMDPSGRVCGWDSFVNWRVGNKEGAKTAAFGCGSPLASLGRAMAENDPERRLNLYAGFFATGADDAFPEMATYTKKNYKDLAVEFYLINQYRWSAEKMDVQRLSKEVARLRNKQKPDNTDISTASSIRLRVAKYKQTKDANKMQFSTAVPYLPFQQGDIDLFNNLSRRNAN